MLAAHSIPSTVSSVYSLSKATWRIGLSLQQLDQNAQIFDIPVRSLKDETRSLGAKCDHLYVDLDHVVKSNGAGPLEPDGVHARIWTCIATQLEEICSTVQDLEEYVRGMMLEETAFIGHVQRARGQKSGRDLLVRLRANIGRHTRDLCMTLLLIKTAFATCWSDGQSYKRLEDLQHMVDGMERSPQDDTHYQLSQTEASLLHYAREIIANKAASTSAYVTPSGGVTDTLRSDYLRSSNPDITSRAIPNLSGQQNYNVEREDKDAVLVNDYDDDLDQDLAKAALDTGSRAFEAQEWAEADSLLQEALRAVQQLPQHQRTFCDLFDLHYKLAISAYHTQEPTFAEEALKNFVLQRAKSDEEHCSIHNAIHILSQLYIRMGHVERARVECERALSGRRRMLGKQSDASMESMALMAHIYVFLNQPARAKIYLAMIPDERRDTILARVEESLGPETQHLDFASLLKSIPEPITGEFRSINGDSQSSRGDGQSVRGETLSVREESPTIGKTGQGALPGTTASAKPQSLSPKIRTSHKRNPSNGTLLEDQQRVASYFSTDEMKTAHIDSPPTPFSPISRTESSLVLPNTSCTHLTALPASNPEPLSRQDILDRIRCQPRDAIEEAVCSGDAITLNNLLHKRRHSWRTKFRSHVRPERVTALHLAALFGEIDMARCLIAANFNINEVPYGYSTPLTPLTFAVGARQVEMVDFLLMHGARPPESDTWGTLAGQLLMKSWLEKTLSGPKNDVAISRIISIFAILLEYGWDINSPYEVTSGKTVLHQAVIFWTGDYKWDLELRKQVTKFLCERGADPLVTNLEGKTPWDLARANGHQDLLILLETGGTGKESEGWRRELVELPGEPVQ